MMHRVMGKSLMCLYLSIVEFIFLLDPDKHKHVNESGDKTGCICRCNSRVGKPLDEYHGTQITKDTHQEYHLRDEHTQNVHRLLEISERAMDTNHVNFVKTSQA